MKKRFSLFLAIICLLCCLGCRSQESSQPLITGWELAQQQAQSIADGVSYTQMQFTDSNGNPHVVYILEVDPEKAFLHKGTSQNGLSIFPTDKQNVMEHMQASVADGLNVVAAVNGDFFAISSTYIPSGLSVKNGVILRENTNFRPFFAFTKDGRYILCDGKSDKLDMSTVDMATGGSHLLVRDGKCLDIETTSELSTISHPRTLSGVRSDNTILLVVIDGRQREHSNGATLSQCAELMHNLGAIQAINHDGGCSSTMVIRTDNRYSVVNSPSDHSLRDVFCSIQVVLKQTTAQ